MKYLLPLLLLACGPGQDTAIDDGVEYLVLTDDEGACEDTAVDGWYPAVSGDALCEVRCCSSSGQCSTDVTIWRDDELYVSCTQCGSAWPEVHCITVSQ